MRYGAMNFPIKPLEDEIRSFAQLGFDYLELALDPPCAHHSVIMREIDRIRRLLNKYGMGLVCHLPTFVYTADLSEEIRRASVEEMLSALQVAAELAAEKVVCHPGLINGLGPYVFETARQYAMESLERIAAAARDHGLVLCLENMFPKYQTFFEPEDFDAVFRQCPTLRLTLDTGHANIGDPNGHRLMRFVELFGERIDHVHVSDNLGRRDDHLPVGAGRIDFKPFMQALDRIGYAGTITLEVFSEDRQDLVRSRNLLEEMIIDRSH